MRARAYRICRFGGRVLYVLAATARIAEASEVVSSERKVWEPKITCRARRSERLSVGSWVYPNRSVGFFCMIPTRQSLQR